MTDKVIDDTVVSLPPKVTVGFSKKINPQQRKGLPQYENEEAQVFIEASFDKADPSTDDVKQAVKDAFSLAKAAVYDQLGVDYDYDPAQQAVIEKLQEAFPGSTVEKPAQHSQGGTKGGSARTAPVKSANPDDKTPYWNQLEVELAAGPVEITTKTGSVQGYPSFWDNRETATGRQPQFKVRNTKAARDAGLEPDVALWLSSAPEGFTTEPV